MKKKFSIALCVLMLCSSLLLVMYTGTVAAYDPAYPTKIFSGTATVIDGYWTNSTEWDDAAQFSVPSANLVFRNKYNVVFSGGLKVYENWLVEFFSDNTNDPGDYVQICYDSNATGSTAPKIGDVRIDYVGHNGTVRMYNGTGSGWAPANLSDITVAQTLNVSKLKSTTHWITEFKIEKQANGLAINNAIRIAAYDASSPSAGVISYPPASQQDVPNSYGLNVAAMYAKPPTAPPMTIYNGNWSSAIDGKWTNDTEWDDAASPSGLPARFAFKNKWISVGTFPNFKVYEQWLVEVFSDNTNDTGDYVQICYAINGTGGLFPRPGDLRIDYVGHNGTIRMYNGTGSGWTPAVLNDTTAVGSLGVSKLNGTSHWITEFSIEKIANGLAFNNSIRVAVYDGNKSSAGVAAFPSTSQQDVPLSYSLDVASMGKAPQPAAPVMPLQATAFNDITVLKGWTWYLFVQSIGGTGTHSYQWYEGSTLLAGQTSSVLPVTKSTAGTYVLYCKVTDSAGRVVNSNNVTMTVK